MLVYDECLRIIHRYNITVMLGLLEVTGPAEMDPCSLSKPVE